MRDIGDGTISVATTSYCGVRQSVLSSSSASPRKKTTTVIYTKEARPIICENPFRKVFARRKEFYQSRAQRRSPSPETSAKKLIWRHTNHQCNNNNHNSNNRRHSIQTTTDNNNHNHDIPLNNNSSSSPRWFTVNANIEPFVPFTITHNIATPPDSPGEEKKTTRKKKERKCSAVNLTLMEDDGDDDGDGDDEEGGEKQPPVELLPDGSGLRYSSSRRVVNDGEDPPEEHFLEVKVRQDGSVITTRRGNGSASNRISVMLTEDGNRVDIRQTATTTVRQQPPAAQRPTTLDIPRQPEAKFAAGRPRSLCPGRGSSPYATPRYNSLPNLGKAVSGGGPPEAGWVAGSDYTSHPKDEAKRLAYTRGERRGDVTKREIVCVLLNFAKRLF